MARLGELERRVMQVLWEAEVATGHVEMTARQVAAHLPDHAYTTILTVLDRLEHKGLVQRSRDQRAHLYWASHSRDDFVAELMHEALTSTDDRAAVLARFVETASEDDAASLQQALRRLLRKRSHQS